MNYCHCFSKRHAHTHTITHKTLILSTTKTSPDGVNLLRANRQRRQNEYEETKGRFSRYFGKHLKIITWTLPELRIP